MADISKIKLNNTDYDIKDAVARQMITGGLEFKVVWSSTDYASSTAPTTEKLATIPQGVVVQYHSGASGYTATGTLSPTDSSSNPRVGFYLIYRTTTTTSLFDEYVVVGVGSGASKTYLWEKVGNTALDLKGVVMDVTLTKETTSVYGERNTFTNSTSAVTASGGSTITALTGVTAETEEFEVTNASTGAISDASLTGTTTFNTDAVKCSYANDTLTISAASTGTVGISTTAAEQTQVATGRIEESSPGVAARFMVGVTTDTDTAIKTLGTLTAAAQTITIAGTNEVVVRNEDTDISVTKHA